VCVFNFTHLQPPPRIFGCGPGTEENAEKVNTSFQLRPCRSAWKQSRIPGISRRMYTVVLIHCFVLAL